MIDRRVLITTTMNYKQLFEYPLVCFHPLEDLLIIVRPHTLQAFPDLRVVLANMLAVPSITTSVVIRERSLQPLKTHIRTAHDGLTHVVEAVNHVPMVILFELVAGGHAGVDGDDGVEAVQLMSHRGGEDSSVGPDDGGWEIVVVLWVRDLLEAHADCGRC
jgi:hypothetical protein